MTHSISLSVCIQGRYVTLCFKRFRIKDSFIKVIKVIICQDRIKWFNWRILTPFRREQIMSDNPPDHFREKASLFDKTDDCKNTEKSTITCRQTEKAYLNTNFYPAWQNIWVFCFSSMYRRGDSILLREPLKRNWLIFFLRTGTRGIQLSLWGIDITLTVKNERFLVKVFYYTSMKLLQQGVLPFNNRNRPSLNVPVKIVLYRLWLG